MQVPIVNNRNLARPRKEPGSAAGAIGRLPSGPVRDELIKRGLDILAALVAIIFVSPLLIVCGLCVWAAFGRWPFARRVCVGQYGRQFHLLTFRIGKESRIANELSGIRESRVGQALALSNLDRLPELLNLLRGDLSLVGPRPLSRDDHQYYAGRIPDYIHREQVRPGIFGWAQLHEQGTHMDIRRQIQFDIWYAQNLTLRLDLKILRLSLRRAFSGQD
jgi:sugar transferase EpsL